MPRRPALPCKYPNCLRLVPYGSKYCEEHSHLHSLEVKSTKVKGDESRWNKARLRFLKLHPFCVRYLNRNCYRRATMVDHIVPHRGNQNFSGMRATGNLFVNPVLTIKPWPKTILQFMDMMFSEGEWIKALSTASQKTMAPQTAFSQNVKGVYFLKK